MANTTFHITILVYVEMRRLSVLEGKAPGYPVNADAATSKQPKAQARTTKLAPLSFIYS